VLFDVSNNEIKVGDMISFITRDNIIEFGQIKDVNKATVVVMTVSYDIVFMIHNSIINVMKVILKGEV